MARKKKGRPVNGILILDKPSGITSNAALQKVKWLYQAQKAGHTGSLDPLATGVLPICLGEATKLSHYLLDANKRYIARCCLGRTTTTGDADGEVINTRPVNGIELKNLQSCLDKFIGEQHQTPPMYSALKHNGRPLYEYARKGIKIERKARQITIFKLDLLNYNLEQKSQDSRCFIEIDVTCSKGTYIRSLCEDIGETLGCGAYIESLRRIESGPFKLEDAITLEHLNDNYGRFSELDHARQVQMDQMLLGTDRAVESLPTLTLDCNQAELIKQGQAIDPETLSLPENDTQLYRLYFNKTLIGLAILDEDYKLRPKRLLFL